MRSDGQECPPFFFLNRPSLDSSMTWTDCLSLSDIFFEEGDRTAFPCFFVVSVPHGNDIVVGRILGAAFLFLKIDEEI